jgi:pyruvate kinase
MNKTKIVATIGPATYDESILAEIIKEGVNVCRLNFSHGSHEEYLKVINDVRTLNDKKGYHTAVLADLQGPKLRLGEVNNGAVEIHTGDKIVLTSEEMVGTQDRVFVSYPKLAQDVADGARILIDDGKIVLKVIKSDGKKDVDAKIIQGGFLRPNKGANFPDTKVSMPCLSEKDYADLNFALDHGVEWVALSFVRSAEDVRQVRAIIDEADSPAKVIAKIEKPEALKEIDEIISVADAIMVARGDLGVEIPMQDVPIIQKELVIKCRKASKPVIIATQMIESMIDSITPTRAEVNDVANAVMDGADAVMLSAETSLGNHPIEVIKAISKIITKSETFDEIYFHYKMPDPASKRFISDAICFNATKMAQGVGATAIVTMSFSGYTGRKISSYRPRANTFVFTANRAILNMLSLIWGVRGFYYDKFESTDRTISDIMQQLKDDGLITKGELIINIASMPITDKAKTNMLKLSEVV